MRDLVVTENITLDGVIDASEGWFAVADDPTGVTDYLNRVSKYVVSGTLGDPEWEPTTVLPAERYAVAGTSSPPAASPWSTP